VSVNVVGKRRCAACISGFYCVQHPIGRLNSSSWRWRARFSVVCCCRPWVKYFAMRTRATLGTLHCHSQSWHLSPPCALLCALLLCCTGHPLYSGRDKAWPEGWPGCLQETCGEAADAHQLPRGAGAGDGSRGIPLPRVQRSHSAWVKTGVFDGLVVGLIPPYLKDDDCVDGTHMP